MKTPKQELVDIDAWLDANAIEDHDERGKVIPRLDRLEKLIANCCEFRRQLDATRIRKSDI